MYNWGHGYGITCVRPVSDPFASLIKDEVIFGELNNLWSFNLPTDSS